MLKKSLFYKLNIVNQYHNDLCDVSEKLFDKIMDLMSDELSKNIIGHEIAFDYNGFYGFKLMINGWQEMDFESGAEIEEKISEDTSINKDCILAWMDDSYDDDLIIVEITLNKDVMLLDNIFKEI